MITSMLLLFSSIFSNHDRTKVTASNLVILFDWLRAFESDARVRNYFFVRGWYANKIEPDGDNR